MKNDIEWCPNCQKHTLKKNQCTNCKRVYENGLHIAHPERKKPPAYDFHISREEDRRLRSSFDPFDEDKKH